MPKRKLLLADDSITIQKVVNLTFADEDVEVVSVSDGNSALDKLREDAPDIVLADVNMPGLTGYEICAQIKARDFDDQIPVVLLVGSFEPFDEEEAERVGADGYLTKPFQSISQLVNKVSELLGDELPPPTESAPDVFNTAPPEFSDRNQPEHELEVADLPAETNAVDADYSEIDSAFRDQVIVEGNDEMEMTEAFTEESGLTGVGPVGNDDDQIEEVTDDFLKTQPLTLSDLKEIALEEEEVGELEDAATDFIETESPPIEIPRVDEPMNPFVPIETDSRPAPEFEEFTGIQEEVSDERANDDEVMNELSPTLSGGIFDIENNLDGVPEPEHTADSSIDLPVPEGASILDLDDLDGMNLLELPPVETDDNPLIESTHLETEIEGFSPRFVETVEDESFDIHETFEPAESESDEADEAHVGTFLSEQEVPSVRIESDEPDIKTKVDQAVSKEMVEAITQRVIETLSEKAIREIAWEVVPDLADLIIKKMADEKLRE